MRLMFSRILYSVAAADFLLLSRFFYKLSQFEEDSQAVKQHIDVNIWVDYLGWTFFVFLAAYLHRNRLRFKTEFAATFNLGNDVQKKASMMVFCDILPFIGVSAILIRVSGWLISLTP